MVPRHRRLGRSFGDATVATAVLDRLPHLCAVISIAGDSYRVHRHRDTINTLRPGLTGRSEGEEFP